VVLTDRPAHRRPASRLAVWMWRLRAMAFGLSSSKEARKFKEPGI
jgi:hypothetical protein